MSTNNSTNAALADLRAYFIASLSQRIDSLTAALSDLAADPEAAADVRQIAHGLRGSGGTYGFPEVTEAATLVEQSDDDALTHRAAELLSLMQALISEDAAQGDPILIASRDEDLAVTLGDILRRSGFRVESVCTMTDCASQVSESSFKLFVVDLDLPDREGWQLLLRLREQFQTHSVPIVAIGTDIASKAAADCYSIGVINVFEKSMELAVVRSAVVAAIERAEQATKTSTLDPLTGLPNRAAFHEMFNRWLSMSERSSDPISVAVMDLDHFKSVNDTHGHLVGDEVLRRFGQVMRERTRRSDYVARWGGEEFVALFYDCKARNAVGAISRLKAAFEEQSFLSRDGKPFKVTFSAGVANVVHGMSPEHALSEADRLLYKAKSAGRNRVVDASAELSLPQQSVLLVEDDDLVARAVKTVFEQEGFDVQHCERAEHVPDFVQVQIPALVILDVQLPDGSGFDVLRSLKETLLPAPVPVLMLTACGEESDVLKGFELGADDYVVKPFSPQQLLVRARRLARS